MDVKFTARAFIVSLVVCLTACAGESKAESDQEDVIHYMQGRVALATAELGKRIEVCNEQSQSNEVPRFEKHRLDNLDATSGDVLVALAHFNHVNSFQCERDARLSLAYEVGTLAAAEQRINKDGADLNAVQSGLLYPSVEVLQYSVSYLKLKPALKQYFTDVIGGEPFELSEALEANAEIIVSGT